jgi:hypothetical protein
MEIKADYQQIVGQVKERNKLYRAIVEIHELVEKAQQTKAQQTKKESDNSYQEKFQKIKIICDNAVEKI